MTQRKLCKYYIVFISKYRRKIILFPIKSRYTENNKRFM